MPDAAIVGAALAALAYLPVPIVAGWRWRRPPSLDDVTDAPPADAPAVSVIVPARDEAPNVERCLTSLLAQRWPRLQVVLVDDHSTDGTGAIARAIAARDARLTVVDAPDLPEGWFGKQWACATGAAHATGELLLFTDADTAHAPDAVPRAANAMQRDALDFLTAAGRQELGSFWEVVAQPQVLGLIALRYGGPDAVNRSPRAVDKIANGQFILVRRAPYDALGGHAAVRQTVAEDLALAQLFFRAGHRTRLVLAERQFAVRMYTGLASLMRGWEKNVYAGGRDAMRGGRVGRAIFPLLLVWWGVWQLLPVAVLPLALAGAIPGAWGWSALAALAALLLFWGGAYARLGRSPCWALTFPIGAVVFTTIAVRATARGRRVSWKGRAYRSA